MKSFSPSADFLERIRQHDRGAVGLCWLKLPQFLDSGLCFKRDKRRVEHDAFVHPSESLAWGYEEAQDYFRSVDEFFRRFETEDSDFLSGLCPRYKIKIQAVGPHVHLVNVAWNVDDVNSAVEFDRPTALNFAIEDLNRKDDRRELVDSMIMDGATLEEAADEIYNALLSVAEESISSMIASFPSIEDCTPLMVRRFEMSLASAADAREEVMTLAEGYDHPDYITPGEAVRFLEWLHHSYGRVIFGSAVDMVDEAKRVGAVDIAKVAALQSFDDDFRSVPKTKYRMTSAEVAGAARYLGQPIMAQNKKRCVNDHVFLEVTRDLIREEMDSDYPHNADHASVLHVGATMTDYSRWSSHEGHQFLFALLEDKDVSRVHSEMTSKLGSKISSMTLPALTSRKGNTTCLKIDGVKEMARLLDKGNRKKILMEKQDIVGFSHDVLFFPDSLYDMSEAEFAWYWRHTGAKVGEAVMFFPDALYGVPTQQSDIYRYEEYYPPAQSVEDIIEHIWPSVLLLTPVLPLHGFAEGVDHLIRHCLTAGWDSFKDWMGKIIHDDYPVELALGSAFDLTKLGPIYKHLLRQLKPIFRRYLARARVSWVGGFQNGYDHRVHSWEKWLKKRRYDLQDGTFVDVEIRARMGEMYRLKFHRSTGVSPLTYSLEVPVERATVMVADLEGSFNIGTSSVFGLDKLKYVPVNYSDWWKLHNWAMAEPIESLSFAVMMTTLNRIRGGLSLGSNVLVDPMLIKDKDVTLVALACYMETARRSNIFSLIENDKDLKEAYQSNLKKVGKLTGKVLLTILSGGLAVPLWFLAKWIMTTHPTIQFVKYPDEPKAVTVPGKRNKKVSVKSLLDRPSHLVLPHKEIHTGLVCHVCNLQKAGKFSSTGREVDGQFLVCTNSELTGEVDFSMDTTAITSMIADCRASEESHTAMGATKLVPHIQKFKHWLEVNVGGLEHHAVVKHIRGGPGTGKTEIIKAMMRSYELQGQSTGVLVPFSKLQTDYIETTVIGEPRKVSFDAQTTWYATKWGKIDVMFVDECTAVRWDLIKAFAVHAGTKIVYLVGDALQTRLNAKAGEGVDPTDEQSGLDMSSIPTHELVKNFRLDAWRVKQKNRKYGYKMIATRHDSMPPRFVSKQQYIDSVTSGAIKTDREFVFAHDSAQQMFGKVSVAGDTEKDNMSVRSSQGLTIKGNVAVSASQLDEALIDVHGMLNVADSRSTGQVFFVYHSSVEDPVVVKLKKELMVSSQEEIDDVWRDPWPTFEKKPDLFEMTEREASMNEYIREKSKLGEVSILTDDQDDSLIEQYEKPKPIVMNLGFDEITQEQLSLWEFFRSVFHFCLPDAVEENGKMTPAIRKSLITVMGQIYSDDRMMGRTGVGFFSRMQQALTIGGDSLWGAFDGKALPKIDGKWYLPLDPICSAIEACGLPVIVFSTTCVGAEYLRVPDLWRAGSSVSPLVLNMSDNHVEKRIVQSLPCYISGLEGQQMLSEIEVVKNGKILYEFRWNGGNLTPGLVKAGICKKDFKSKLPLVPRLVVNMPKNIPLQSRWRYDERSGPTLEVPSVLSTSNVEGREPPLQVSRKSSSSSLVDEFQLSNKQGTIIDRTLIELLTASGSDDLFVGHKPTFERMQLPDLERRHENLALRYAPPSSSWKEVVLPQVEQIHRKVPLRLGTDAYKLASFIDPSGAKLSSSMLNDVGPVQGVKEKTNVRISWEGFIHKRTRAGRIADRKESAYRSFLPGMGNHYNNSPVESLIAAQRVGKLGFKVKLTAEAKAYADEVVNKTFREGWLKNYVPNRERCNAKIEEAIRALKSRNYHGRADAELKRTFEPRLTCSNKDQFKPIKNGKLNLEKGGQVLLQSPPTVNMQFIAWMRVQGLLFKDRMQDDVFTDDYESPAEFRKRFNRAVKTLPEGVSVAIVDGETWDSQQNEVTRYMEMKFHQLLGAVDSTIKAYFEVRGNLKFIMFGIFQGCTNGEKGSGFLDTKLGNTMLQAMVSNQVIRGSGPKVVGIKGDDYIRIQTAVHEDVHETVKVKKLLGMKLNIDVGKGGEFCGNSVSRAGMFPSITRAAIKAVAAKAKDYDTFTKHQQAYRDKIAEYQDVGLEECIAFSAFAESVSRQYVQICLAVLNSLAHINRFQWEQSTRRRINPTFFLPSAAGPVLV